MQMTEEKVWTRAVLADGTSAPQRRSERSRQTTHRILAGSLGALLVLLVAGYVIVAQVARHQALADSRHVTELVGETVIEPQLTSAFLRGRPGTLDRLNAVLEDEDGLVHHTLIRKVKIWSPDGKLLYSNDPSEIGRAYRPDDERQSALDSGRTVATVSDLSQAEDVSERSLGTRMVEVYTPLESANGEHVLFETYISYDEVKHRRASLFTTFLLVTGGLLAVFALFQVRFFSLNLRWLRKQQVELASAAEEVSTRERRNVARDLHDGVVQELIGTSFLVEGARASLGSGDTARADMLLGEMGESVRSSVQALRSTLIVVYPPSLAEDGLAQALDDLAQPLRTRGVEVTVDASIGRGLPGPAVEATYRVAQEALRNVGRHAHAATVSIRVSVEEQRLCLVIRDDGVGLPPELLASLGRHDGHLGLRNLVDAAHEVHGRLEMSSARDRGTEIRWETPL